MSVIASYLINGANPVTVGGTGTGVLYFQPPPSQNLWNVGATGVNTSSTSNQIGGTVSATNATGQLSVPGRSILNGQKFTVTASGNLLFGTGEASTTCTIRVYANTGTFPAAYTSPTYTDLCGTSFQVANAPLDNVYLPWTISLDFEGDTLSGILQVVKSGIVNGSVVAAAADTALTGISFASEPAFGLVVGVQFGASISGNSANMYQFQVFAQ
jgi:hypothetical protein